jgi:hypothetical protein
MLGISTVRASAARLGSLVATLRAFVGIDSALGASQPRHSRLA